MTGPLKTGVAGNIVPYGRFQGRDSRGRAKYQFWLFEGVVAAPVSSEISEDGGPAGWLNEDRMTLYFMDTNVPTVSEFTWFPLANSKAIELLSKGSKIGPLAPDFGPGYVAANARAWTWRSPFTGDVWGTQLDVINEAVKKQ